MTVQSKVTLKNIWYISHLEPQIKNMLLIPQEDVVGVTVAPVREVKKKNALQQKKTCLPYKQKAESHGFDSQQK